MSLRHVPSFSLLLLPVLTVLVACGPSKDRFRLKGKLENVGHADIYVYADDATFSGIDTLHIVDGKFTYERPLTQSTVLTLLYPNFTRTTLVATPGTTVKMKGDAASLSKAHISGGDDNQLLTALRQELSGKAGDDRRKVARFIRQHAATMAAVALYQQYFAAEERLDDTGAELLDLLTTAQPKSAAVAYLARLMEPRRHLRIGKKLAEVSVKDLSGKTWTRTTLTDGRRLLIVSCATWAPDYNRTISQLREVSQRSDYRTLLVSLDSDAGVFRRRLRRDSAVVARVVATCDGAVFEGTARALGLTRVPEYILTDEKGVITDHGTDLDALKNRLP